MARVSAVRARKEFKKCDRCGKRMAKPRDGNFDRVCFGCKCVPGEHEPDQDDPTTCFSCGWPTTEAERPSECVCPTCDGTGVYSGKHKDVREVLAAYRAALPPPVPREEVRGA